MSHVYQTKAERVKNLLGRKIQYRKNGNRKGWTGTIDTVAEDRMAPGGYTVTVQYDNGVRQEYCIEAVQGFGTPVRFEDAAGYLHFVDSPHEYDTSQPIYFLIDQKGTVHGSGNDYDRLCAKAEEMARRNSVIIKFYVCRAMTMIRKEPMPVTRTELNF